MAQTTTTQIPPAIQQFYDRTLLARTLPYLCHDKFGQRRPLPQGSGDTIKFRKYPSLPASTTPLGEGVNPPGGRMAYTEVMAKVQKYGDFLEITEEVEIFNVDKVLTEASELNGEQAGLSADTIHRDVLVSGSSVQYSNGSTRAGLTEIITKVALDKVIRTLANNNVKFFTSIIKAGVGIGTLPIRPAYWGIVDPDVKYDLEEIEGFIPVEKYASQGPVDSHEIGAYRNIRFVETTNAKVFADSGGTYDGTKKSASGSKNDVYATLIFSPDAYGITEIRGKGVEMIYHDKKIAGGALEVASTSGWKLWTTLVILDDARMVRLESCASI